MNEIKVSVSVPKAIGESSKITIFGTDSVFNIITNNTSSDVYERIFTNEREFNRFVLVYLNGERIKEPSTMLSNINNEIDIIIPMAGG